MPVPAAPETATTLAGPVILLLTGAGVFIGAIVRGWMSGGKPKEEAQEPGEPKNVALAGALIDSSSAKQLSRAMGDLNEQLERSERSSGARGRELMDHMDQLGRDLRRLCEGTDTLDRTLGRSADQSEENVRTLKLLVEGLPRAIASALRNDEMLRAADQPVPTPPDDPLIPGRMRRGEV